MAAQKGISGRVSAFYKTRHTSIRRETFSYIHAQSRAHIAFQPINPFCDAVSRRGGRVLLTRHVRSQQIGAQWRTAQLLDREPLRLTGYRCEAAIQTTLRCSMRLKQVAQLREGLMNGALPSCP